MIEHTTIAASEKSLWNTGYPILDFIENFIVAFVDQLEAQHANEELDGEVVVIDDDGNRLDVHCVTVVVGNSGRNQPTGQVSTVS